VLCLVPMLSKPGQSHLLGRDVLHMPGVTKQALSDDPLAPPSRICDVVRWTWLYKS
jgi:hypothetical protein